MRRLVLGLCALLACLSLATCGDPWFVGQGPSWLPLVQASFDLRAAFDGKQVGIAALERLELGGTEYVFMVASDGSPQVRLYVLSADTLDFRYSFEQPYPGFNRTLLRGADPEGGVRCGHTLLSANFSTTPETSTALSGPKVVSDHIKNYQFFTTSMETTTVEITPFTSAWSAETTFYPVFTSMADLCQLIDIDFINNASLPFAILAKRGRSLFAGRYPDIASISAATQLLETGERTGPVPAFKEGGWLTADGLIGGTDSDKEEGLARYAYGTSELLDSIPMRDTHSSAIFFDPDGKHWYVYDDWSGRLYMLRTWWQ